MDTQHERKLAAIMVADVAGFSRLMERDESLTFARLRRLREEVTHPKVEEHGGRVIKTTGDGFLAEFASATAAVRSGIELQRAVMALECDKADDDRIRFRIGVNVGDIIVDGTDVAGDGVNIAARLEAMSPIDGLCVSSAVRDQIRDDLGLAFEDLGERMLKNISRPIRAFQLNVGASAPEQTKLARAADPTQPIQAPRLSLVVLPFVNASGDPSQEYFADGITDDVTTQLCKIRGATVIGRNTAFTYKGKTVDIRAIGRDLGVRYVLQGGVDRHENDIDVGVQVTDTLTGAELWSDSIEVNRNEARNIRREVVTRMTRALRMQLVTAESKRSLAENPDNADAVDLVMQGWGKFYQGAPTLEKFRAAGALFARAIEAQADYSPALVGRAFCSVMPLMTLMESPPDRAQRLADAERQLREATAIDSTDASAYATLCCARWLRGDLEGATAASDEAVQINPNLPFALGMKARCLSSNGQQEEAIDLAQRALALSPREPSRILWILIMGVAHLRLGRYQDAVFWLEKSALHIRDWSVYSFLAAAYAQLGDTAKAESAKQRLLEVAPNFSIDFYKSLRVPNSPSAQKQLAETYFAGLRMLGIPE